MLYSLTIIVNFGFLVVAVWLGVYLVTRSPRSLVAWLTGLTSWSIAGLFLNLLLVLTPPPCLEKSPDWAELVFTVLASKDTRMQPELLASRLVGDTRQSRNSTRLPLHALERYLAGLPLFLILR